MNNLGHRVFVLVNEVFREVFHHEFVGFLRHPGVDERREVQAGIAIECELVVDNLVRGLRLGALNDIPDQCITS